MEESSLQILGMSFSNASRTGIMSAAFLILLFISYLALQLCLTALNRFRNSKMEELYGDVVSEKVSQVISDAEVLLASLRFLSGGVLIAIGVVGFPFLLSSLSAFSSGISQVAIAVLGIVSLVGLCLFLLHLTRSFAATRAEVICYFGLPILRLLRVVSKPVGVFLHYGDSLVSNFVRITPFKERDLVYSLDELSELAQRSAQAGEILSEEHEMLEGVFSFSETSVSEIMTPRTDVVCISLNASLEEIVQTIHSNGFSRLLVVGEDLDDVRGMLLSKDLLQNLSLQKENFDLSKLIREVLFVSSTSLVRRVFKQLRKSGAHFAVVNDEHGGTDGIVTMEDILEEIVGDIFDETDVPDEEIQHSRTEHGELLVDGGLSIMDLNEIYHLEIPEGEYETVAGFVIHELGRIPEAGDIVTFNGHQIQVEEIDSNRVTLLKITSSNSSNPVSEEDRAAVSPQSEEIAQAEPSDVRKAS